MKSKTQKTRSIGAMEMMKKLGCPSSDPESQFAVTVAAAFILISLLLFAMMFKTPTGI